MPGERLLVGTAVAIGLLMVALTPLVIDRAAKQRTATAEARTLAPSLSTVALAADAPLATTAGRVVSGANEPTVTGISGRDGQSDDSRPVRVVGEAGTAEPSATTANPSAAKPVLASTNATDGAPDGASGQGGSTGGTVTLASVGGDADVPVAPALTTVPPRGAASASGAAQNGSASAKPSGASIQKPSAGSAVTGGGAGARATFASLDASQQQMIASRCVDVLMRPASYEPDLAVVCRSLAQMQR